MNGRGAWVCCGAARVPVPMAAAWAPAAALPALPDPDAAVAGAIAQPLGAPRLRELARGASSVAIAVPDASRPCPSATVLRHLLAELQEGGVSDERLQVLVGCGLHARTTAAERRHLLGDIVCARLRVGDAHALESPTAYLGTTSRGAPIHIAAPVAAADLTITVGVVEPHLYAGFSGGVKGVAIGCAGHETIAWTHRPDFISQPGVLLGELADNPFQQTLAEVAAHTSLGWAVNVVVNERGQTAAAAAGAPALVQASLASRYAPAWLHETDEEYDVLVAGVPAPKSANLYQASRAATYAGLAARPALVAGGLLVLCADLPQEGGDGPAERAFLALLSAAAAPAALVARGLREPLGPGGQRAFVVARVLGRCRLAVVGACRPAFLAPLARLGVAAYDSVAAAVAAAERRLGREARVLAVADGMATIVRRRSAGDPAGHTQDTSSAEVAT